MKSSLEKNSSLRRAPSDADWDAIWHRDVGHFLATGPSTRTRIRLALRLLRSFAPPSCSLLDVGCGSGLLLASAARMGVCALYAGSDIASASSEAARAAYPQFAFHTFDIQKEHLAPARFDAITCLATLDMIRDDRAALGHMSAMLAPGGHLIISVQHDPMYWTALDEMRAWRRYRADELKARALEVGLETVRIFSWGWPFYHMYYRLLVQMPEGMHQAGGMTRTARIAGQLAYLLFFLDDLCIPLGRGRLLFAVFKKQ